MLWVLFELHQQVDAIQMGTQNIYLYKEIDKKYTGFDLKTMELLDCALIVVCAVIRLYTVAAWESTSVLDRYYHIYPKYLDRQTWANTVHIDLIPQ